MIKKIESNFNKKLNEKEKEIKNLKTQLENLKKGYEGQIKEIAEKNKREIKELKKILIFKLKN
jgi:DNA anti-recombination protein RmuC